MNELKPDNNPIVQCIEGVRGYVDTDGVVQLNLEDIARGLGFTRIAASGNEVIRWERVDKHLSSFGILVPTCGHEERDVPPLVGERPEYITEPIFYLLSMKAENATARAFQHTIAYDVLPAIRKYGFYGTPETVDAMLSDPDFGIRLLSALKDEREQKRALAAKVEADKPKVLFADAVNTSDTSILVGELAKLIKQNGVDIGPNRLFEWLRNNGYLIRRQGCDYNTPTQRAMDLGVLEIKERAITNPDGSVRVTKTPKVTGKGQQYFISKFLGAEA